MTNDTGKTAYYTLRLSLFFGAVFLIVGSYLPFFPVWLDAKKLGDQEIGIILAVPLIVRVFFTPVLSFIADRIGDHRRILIVLAWGTLVSLMGLFFTSGFWSILVVSVCVAVFWTTIMPLSEAVALVGMREAGVDYGRARIWGSLTFIGASAGGGFLLGIFGAAFALWLLIFASVCVIFASYMLPQPQGRGRLKAATVGPQIKFADAASLVRNRIFLLFLATTSLVQASHAVFYGFGTLHWQGIGLSSGIIGILWATGVVAEIVLFYFSARLFSHVGAGRLLFLASIAGIIRWTITAFDPPIAILFFCQVLHAFTFGAAHLASVDFVSKSVPHEQTGTAMGLYAAVTAGIAMGTATIGAGALYKTFEGDAFFAMALLSLLGFIGACLLKKSWGGTLLRTAQDQ